MTNHKRCHRCGEIKELDADFYKDRGSLDGYHDRCKVCIESTYADRGRRKNKQTIEAVETVMIEGEEFIWSDE